MLRDWNAGDESQGKRHEFRSRDDPPAAESAAVLREWSSAAPEVVNEDVEHELAVDPLSGSVVSGLSMPVFGDVDAVPNPFDDEASVNITTYGMQPIAENEELQMSAPSAEVMKAAFDSVDVEACQIMTPISSEHLILDQNENDKVVSSRTVYIKQKMNEVWQNPAAKFKLIVGASVFIVIICVIAIAGSSSGDRSANDNGAGAPTKGTGFVPVPAEIKQTGRPTPVPSSYDFGTLEMASSTLSDLPTFSPTEIPTYKLELPPTDLPTILQTANPSNAPTLSPATASPTSAPITLSPTMDCSDSKGSFLTYNDKLRDCSWLDNGNNGAKSDRKDMNCLSSDLGDKCRYTCRLYNGCMNDLLSRIDAFAGGEDISIGNACTDKEGTFMANNHIPRNCSWIEEDPYTAPMKKNLNCGTPDEPRTELGAMCPGSCAGYNECGKGGRGFSASNFTDGVATAVDDDQTVDSVKVDGDDDNERDDNVDDDDDDNDDANGGQFPTLSPTFDASSNVTTAGMTRFGENATCMDADGEFQTHVGPAHLRQCRWFNRDGDGLTVDDKLKLNCHITEIGMNCLETCGCMEDRDDDYVDDDDNGLVPTLAPTALNLTSMPTIETCDDADGEFQTHVGDAHFRQCRWFNRDGDGLTIAEKKKLNCHITEIGMNCLETCGCIGAPTSSSSSAWEVEDKQIEQCIDPTGLFETHEPGQLEQCDWLDDSDEKKQLNCGLTAIGNACICRCPIQGHQQNVLIQDVSWDFGRTDWDIPKATPKPTNSPTKTPKNYEGIFDEAGKYMSLDPYADATIAENDPDANYGDTLVLRVAPPTGTMQSVILFDVSFAAKVLGTTFGSASLHLYATGSSTSGVAFKQMDGTNWQERKITWNSTPGGEGADELILSFLNNIVSDTWYEVDVTAAVRDALERGKQYVSIRISSDETEVSFASKEREDVRPQLVIDTDTAAPTLKPTFPPSPSPSMSPAEPTEAPTTSPVIPLDCYDHKGQFKTSSGEKQSCSWFDVGDGALKKEMNCYGDAGMFCQAKCSEYNGCDDMTCEDRAGSYATHSGWTAECSWLLSGHGELKLEMNCGTDEYPITELGKRCQATCGAYNGCSLNSLHAVDLPSNQTVFSEDLSAEYSMPQEEVQASTTAMPSSDPIPAFDCLDKQGTFKTNTGSSQSCSWLNIGNGALKKELNCQGDREARLFCQSSCGKYNGCDEMNCQDREGSYATHSGWAADCSWLLSGLGTLTLEQNCGTDQYPITELGKRCQATCGDYNGCNAVSSR